MSLKTGIIGYGTMGKIRHQAINELTRNYNFNLLLKYQDFLAR